MKTQNLTQISLRSVILLSAFGLLLAIAALPAHAETFEECMSSTLTRGSESSKRQELNKRCDNTSTNHKECKEAADLVRKAVEANQLAVAETCRKQAKNGLDLAGQDKSVKGAAAVSDDAKTFTASTEAKFAQTSAAATKGKDQSEKAVKMVMDDPLKVKPDRKPIIQKILGDFDGTDYANVKSLQDYATALKKIDEAWKSLQRNPDMAQESYADAYEATSTYLNAEEVRLGSSYQKNQMTAASTAFNLKSAADTKISSAFGDATKSGSNSFGSLSTLAQAAGAASALSGAAGSSAAAAATDPGASSISTPTPPTSLLTAGTSAGNGLDSAKDFAAGGTSQDRASSGNLLGSTSPKGAESGVAITSSASKMDTSLRDSLKRKLGSGGPAGDMEGLGTEQAAVAAAAAAAKDPKAAPPGTVVLDANGVPSVVPGPTDATDFKMSRSETDDAVNGILAGFEDADKNQTNAELASTEDAGGRHLASVNESTAGIEGRNSSNLFVRMRSTLARCVRKGCVTNGISNKKI
ncbi:MAG: hypothetical protein ACXWQO_10070 [Bdellovibrionota bacterium]